MELLRGRNLLGIAIFQHCFKLVSMATGIEMEIANHVFDGYDPGMRPINRTQEALNITLSYRLYQLVDMDDTAETITAISWISLLWVDPLIKWNPDDYGGISSITIPCTRIWRPDITIYNAVHAGDQDLRKFENFNAQVSYQGDIRWSIRTMLITSCSMRLAEFPWDTQICNVTMASWLYDSSKITLKAESDYADMRYFRRNGVWNVIRVPIITQSNMYPCCPSPFHELTVIYMIKRRGLYYCFNILFPSVLLLGVTMLSFYIPTETGEKVNIPVTMFLSQSFLLFAITQYMPVQSDVIPAIGYILLGIMMLIGLCILCNVAVCHVYYKFTGDPPPQWVVHLFSLGCDSAKKNSIVQQQMLEMQDGNDTTHQHGENTHVTLTSMGANGGPVVKLASRARTERQRRLGLDGPVTYPGEQWKAVAHRLNQILCLLTVLATSAFAITIVALYMRSKHNTQIDP